MVYEDRSMNQGIGKVKQLVRPYEQIVGGWYVYVFISLV